MKVKTSISLSENLLREIEQQINGSSSRSEFLEAAAWAYLGMLRRHERDQRDMEIINRNADRLNAEAEAMLAYQVPL